MSYVSELMSGIFQRQFDYRNILKLFDRLFWSDVDFFVVIFYWPFIFSVKYHWCLLCTFLIDLKDFFIYSGHKSLVISMWKLFSCPFFQLLQILCGIFCLLVKLKFNFNAIIFIKFFLFNYNLCILFNKSFISRTCQFG